MSPWIKNHSQILRLETPKREASLFLRSRCTPKKKSFLDLRRLSLLLRFHISGNLGVTSASSKRILQCRSSKQTPNREGI